MSLPPPDETRALAERVRELRQGLEEVEARIRELSVPAHERALEPIDAPTLLTTNHAQRQVRRERVALILGACAAAGLVALGIGIGALLRSPPGPIPEAPPAPAAVAPGAPAEASPGPADSAPGPAAVAASAASAVPAPPGASASVAAGSSSATATPAATARRKNDYGF